MDLLSGRHSRQTTALHRIPATTKLILFLALVAGMVHVDGMAEGATALVLALCLLMLAQIPLAMAVQLATRLKYFFLILLLLHGGLTPGDPVAVLGWSTGLSWDGLAVAATLTLHLVALLLLAVILTRTTPPSGLALGISTLLAPLGKLGLPVAMFSRVLTLAVGFLPSTFDLFRDLRRSMHLRSPAGPTPLRTRLREYGRMVALVLPRLLAMADLQADARLLRSGAYDGLPRWPLRHPWWSVPAAVGVAAWTVWVW
ncbi:MAG: hypothetical protein COX57_09360 [Alphaproteobacteria bacterium CG_4_10_14_0_2_um_filter_63_37]|nr:MAG: hypothetical protein AUJ55_02305 [Proteobacteria bacterium CG1_02_64_396]PJA24270.1 MAG: hypothetical protein COX57_09360 [Alphaproteobacteria bacterium CG_4_10_14_0_2_um_filter_63_37]